MKRLKNEITFSGTVVHIQKNYLPRSKFYLYSFGVCYNELNDEGNVIEMTQLQIEYLSKKQFNIKCGDFIEAVGKLSIQKFVTALGAVAIDVIIKAHTLTIITE